MTKNSGVISFEFIDDFSVSFGSAVVSLGTIAHAESAHRHMTLDVDYGLSNVRNFISDSRCAFWLAWSGDTPIGVFGGKVRPLFFSRDLIAEDILWYVLPEHRGSRVGLQLLSLFERWAFEHGAKDLRIGQTSQLDPKVFNGILGSKGYELVGSYFVRKA